MKNTIDSTYTTYKNDPTPANRDAVIRASHRICWHWAHKRMGFTDTPAVSVDDLFQEAQIGVLQALQRYDGRGTFSAYALMWIRGKTGNYVLKHKGPGVYKKSKYRDEAERKFAKTRNDVERGHPEFHNHETISEIARRLMVPEHHVFNAWVQRQGYKSLDSPILTDGTSGTHKDRVPSNTGRPDRITESRIALRRVRDAVEAITHVKRRVFADNMLAGCPRTPTDIARDFGLTRERGRQLQDMIRSDLREAAGI